MVYNIMRRACTTTHMKVADDVSWRRISRSRWYCGSRGSGGEPDKDEQGKSLDLLRGDAGVPCFAGKRERDDLTQLTRRQRKRLREKNYWDNVLRSHTLQLQRRWSGECRRFNETIEEYQDMIKQEYEQMTQEQAATSMPRISSRQGG